MKLTKFEVKLTFNDKHQQKHEKQEFSRTSTKWTIHPKYDQAAGNNYDLCLVKIEEPLDLITGNSLIFLMTSLILMYLEGFESKL